MKNKRHEHKETLDMSKSLERIAWISFWLMIIAIGLFVVILAIGGSLLLLGVTSVDDCTWGSSGEWCRTQRYEYCIENTGLGNDECYRYSRE